MNRIMLVVLSIAAMACSKSAEIPVEKKETTGPAVMDPRAAKPMLDKARKAAAAANARSAESADAMKDFQ